MKTTRGRFMKTIPLALTALSLAISQHSFAQRDALEEIIVTAQKREQRQIEVPISITAISGEDLLQKGVSNLQDLSFNVPGMSLREDGPGSYLIFMRGLANTDSGGALVGVYLDEAPMTLTGYDQLDMRPLDLERVEVLKGPQGTLYGQGSIAGTVKYVTKAPLLDQFEASLSASLADVDGGETKKTVTTVVNIPVIEDIFALRLAATMERGGGWQDQPEAGIKDGNYQDLDHYRLRALWQVSDDLAINAMIVSHSNYSKLGLGYEQPDRTVDVSIDPSQQLVAKDYEYDLYNLKIEYDFDSFSVLSTTTYIQHDHQYPFSYIGTEETFYDNNLEGISDIRVDVDQITQEFRVTSSGAGPLNWTGGVSMQKLDRDFVSYRDLKYYGSEFTLEPAISQDISKNYAVFGDISYQFTDALEVGVGIRYFEDDRETFNGTRKLSDTFDSIDPRVYVSYAVAEDANVYFNVGKGFRSGGFNADDLPSYDPESVINYELGAKAILADGAISAEIAAYFTDYKDMLRRGLLFIPADNNFQELTSNIGNAEVKGLEGAITYHATDKLTLNASFSYIDSEVTSVDAQDATNKAGDPTDYVPEFSYTLGLNYDFDITATMPAFFRLDYSYRDEVSYVDRTSFPEENLPQESDKLSLLNARVGVTWDNYNLEIYSTNLTNANDSIDPYVGWKNANRTKPRTIGVKFGIDF